ncbi:SpoIIIAH-like family protein [Bengtsoniella intestinalis]|uniref:SpoIIIAH-like family protein n=1 Tax=Bengtsoniella intestinalis TaxID=3073143 RepID=UPI00391F7F85
MKGKRLWRQNFKRNASLVTMGILVCGAAALNWSYSTQAGVEVAAEAEERVVGQTVLVSSDESDTILEVADMEDGVAVVSADESDYFATARLTRQQARDSAVFLLQEAAAQEGADEAVATMASQEIQNLAAYTLAETQIENLVTAKGYVDCVAFMGEESVSVVVGTVEGDLTTADVAKISDIAMSETGYTASQVKILASD